MKKRDLLNRQLESFEWSPRTLRCLHGDGITTIGQLISRTPLDLLVIRQFGKRSLNEVQDVLKEIGLTLDYKTTHTEAVKKRSLRNILLKNMQLNQLRVAMEECTF